MSLNATVKNQIRTLYNGRCVFCLSKTSVEGSHCVHILDASGKGATQVSTYSELGIIPEDYERQSKGNGIILCASCHQGLFSYDYIAFCPPKEVLQYLIKYVKDTPAENQLPLYRVFHYLDASNQQGLGIPDPSTVLPYLGLYTIVHLQPTEMREFTHCTPFFPPLSELRNGQWENAASEAVPTARNTAHIFDALAVNASGQHTTPGLIPLHPDHPHYSKKLYWRLPRTSLGGILSAAISRALQNSPAGNTDDKPLLSMLLNLCGHLLINTDGVDAELSSDSEAEPSNDSEAGPSGEAGWGP